MSRLLDDAHPPSLPWRRLVWIFAAALLITPAVAMQFTDEVAWSLGDFAGAAALLAAAGLAAEVLLAAGRGRHFRLGAALGLAGLALAAWVNLAVGIVGTGPNPANLAHGALLIAGVVGATTARMRPRALQVVAAALAGGILCIGTVAIATGLVGGLEGSLSHLALAAPFAVAAWLLGGSAHLSRAAAG